MSKTLDEILDNHATAYVRKTIDVVTKGGDLDSVMKQNDIDEKSKAELLAWHEEEVGKATAKKTLEILQEVDGLFERGSVHRVEWERLADDLEHNRLSKSNNTGEK